MFPARVVYGSGAINSGSVDSALFTYLSPLYMRRTWTTEHRQLVCYDISDNPNTAVLLLDPRTFIPSPDALRKLPLNEDGDGVLLFPNGEQYFGSMSLIDSPYERLWCNAGDRYRYEETKGYHGADRVSGKLSALPCTMKPRPARDYGPPGILPAYNPKQPNFLAMDEYLNNLIEAEKKATATDLDDPEPVGDKVTIPSFIPVEQEVRFRKITSM